MSTTEESRRVVETFYGAVGRGDMETVTASFADDVVVEVMGRSPISGRHVGREAFLADAMGPVIGALDPDSVKLATTWEIFAAEGDRVAARMTGAAISRSGRRYDNSYCQLFRIRDGQIAEMYEYLDTALLEDAIFDNELTSRRG
jgi:ketosteroid isomerase-like protein